MAPYYYMKCLVTINHKGSFCIRNTSIEVPLGSNGNETCIFLNMF